MSGLGAFRECCDKPKDKRRLNSRSFQQRAGNDSPECDFGDLEMELAANVCRRRCAFRRSQSSARTTAPSSPPLSSPAPTARDDDQDQPRRVATLRVSNVRQDLSLSLSPIHHMIYFPPAVDARVCVLLRKKRKKNPGPPSRSGDAASPSNERPTTGLDLGVRLENFDTYRVYFDESL